MTDVDGFAFAEQLQQRGVRAPIVMMLTTATRRDERASGRELRIAAHVTKPIKKSDLFDAVVQALRLGDAHPASLDHEARTPPPMQPLRLLLAEDNIINQKLMRRLLEKAGHEVTLVRTGRAALDALGQSSFDMVLMDVQMPEMDGFEATAAIRAERAEHRRAHPAHRDHRARDARRSRALPERRIRRLRVEAGAVQGAVRHDRSTHARRTWVPSGARRSRAARRRMPPATRTTRSTSGSRWSGPAAIASCCGS